LMARIGISPASVQTKRGISSGESRTSEKLLLIS
jgi:hypothetical protein